MAVHSSGSIREGDRMKEGSYMSLHKAIIRVLAFVAGGIVVLLGLLDVYLMQSSRSA